MHDGGGQHVDGVVGAVVETEAIGDYVVDDLDVNRLGNGWDVAGREEGRGVLRGTADPRGMLGVFVGHADVWDVAELRFTEGGGCEGCDACQNRSD